MEYYKIVLKKYAVFSGRARRKEYWMFVLWNIIISIVISIIGSIVGLTIKDGNSSINILNTLYSLAVFIPSLAVSIRRMHDTNHSGWWILFPIVNLVFLLTNSTAGDNKYGANPKGIPSTPAPSVA